MSILIKIKDRKVADIPSLIRLVLRYVYEKKTMRADEINLMEKSIAGWSKKALITEPELYLLQRMGWMLKKNQEGKFDRRKMLFEKHKINWRRFHKELFYDRGDQRIH